MRRVFVCVKRAGRQANPSVSAPAHALPFRGARDENDLDVATVDAPGGEAIAKDDQPRRRSRSLLRAG
jgi:hypothetical protein